MKQFLISSLKSGLFFILLLFSAAAACGDAAIELGDKYAESGFYKEAITEYMRFLYFNSSNRLQSDVYEKTALAAFKDKDYSLFKKNMQESVRTAAAVADKERKSLLFVQYALSAGKYNDAIIVLDELLGRSSSTETLVQCAFLMGVSCVYTFQWETAYIMFEEYFKKTDTFSLLTEGRVLSLIKYGRDASYIDEGIAKTLSYIIPGAGQMYAGDFAQGVNSLAVTGLAGTMLVFSLFTYRFQDAAFIFIFIFQRFYVGSSYHADRIAYEKNKEKKQMIADGIFTLLMQDTGTSE